MKRVKKTYSITEMTITLIQKIADESLINESYALDNIVVNYYRMTHKGETLPIANPRKQIHQRKTTTDEKEQFIKNNPELTEEQKNQIRQS